MFKHVVRYELPDLTWLTEGSQERGVQHISASSPEALLCSEKKCPFKMTGMLVSDGTEEAFRAPGSKARIQNLRKCEVLRVCCRLRRHASVYHFTTVQQLLQKPQRFPARSREMLLHRQNVMTSKAIVTYSLPLLLLPLVTGWPEAV